MGQKVHPVGFRIGVIRSWKSNWYSAKKSFSKYLKEDAKIRKIVKEKLSSAGISWIEIKRAASRLQVNIHSAKPGLIIGKKGKGSDDLKIYLKNMVKRDVNLMIFEVRKPDSDAQLVAEAISNQLERRVNFRRAAKDAISKAMRAGAEGIKVAIGGRLNGADIARTEKYKEGRVPLHTMRADIDYAEGRALTTYGIIGVKVWIFKGEKFAPGEEPVDAMQL